MFDCMIATDIAKLEMEQLDRKIARLHRAGLVRNEGKRQLLASMAAAGSHVLMSLGGVLTSLGSALVSAARG